MSVTITTFEKVELHAAKSGKCVCGKRLRKNKTFHQTINPWNKNMNGFIKTKHEIYDELKSQIEIWKSLPVRHTIPTYWQWTNDQREDYDKGRDACVIMSCGRKILINKEDDE